MTNRLFRSIGRRAWSFRRLVVLFLALATFLIPATFAASTADGGERESRRAAPPVAQRFSPCQRASNVDCASAVPDKGDELDASWCRQTPQRDCLAEAGASGRETFIVFGASWCGACRAYERVTLGNPQVKRRLKRYGRVYVDTEMNDGDRKRRSVEVVPTTVLLGRDGNERGRRSVYLTIQELSDFLDAMEDGE
jgi:thiol:disulfide interchange protein